MSNSVRKPEEHLKLFLPGPTEVREEILDAQGQWMIGHRMPESIALFGRIQPKLRQAFRTQHRVYVTASSGTGMWEAATRNCVAKRVLHCTNGSFGDRWVQTAIANGKEVEVLEAEWGQPILPEMVVERLANGGFDAVAFVQNETSVGIANPAREIAQAIRQTPGGADITIMVDSVSGMTGMEMEPDRWDIDIVLTSSQKAFALPPGLAFASVSERAFEKAKTVPYRGYYFDYITLEKYLVKDQTPATPAISLLYALDKQLDTILDEGMEARWARHMAMRNCVIEWANSRGFALFADEQYASPTVTTIANTHGIVIADLNKFLRTRGMVLSNGYGKLKEKCFRIGHMGDWQVDDIKELLANVDDYLHLQGISW
ncbi:MAG: alanine--glyoxylate aminotransferase family protein [Anaerolineae bacterium]|nr:alanine--glyoxylate aminotransferase family protein [Anaerolineae bacterium]MCO5192859.1 alanine--glyoxylate aminotransferase family protein [Anaerolineae bacterium]